MKGFQPFLGILCALAFSAATAFAQDEQEMEKLRTALRTAVTQQRDLQNQIAGYQAADIAGKAEIERLKSANQKTIADLDLEKKVSATQKAEVEKRDAVIAGAQAALEKYKKDYDQQLVALRKTEADNFKNKAKVASLENLVEAQRRQNVDMYTAGMEILKRYESFWLGDALLAREPFVGNTKVKYQRLAQEGYDKIFAARIREEETKNERRKNLTDRSDQTDPSKKSKKNKAQHSSAATTTAGEARNPSL